MSHEFEPDTDEPDACRHCLLGPLAHEYGKPGADDIFPDTDIRRAMSDDLRRMGLMPDQSTNTDRSSTSDIG